MSLTLDSKEVKLFVGQDGSNFYLDATDISGLPLSCEIKAWSTLLVQRTNCNDISFSYFGSNSDIKIYVQTDNDQWTWTYNINTRRFTDATRGDSNTNNNSSIQLSTSDSYPDLSQYLNLTVRVLNSNWTTDTNFQWQVRFTISKRDNNWSYYTANTNDYWISNSYYTFSSSDYGYRTLTNYIQFNNSGTYKIRVENTQNGQTSEITLYVNTTCTGSCNTNNNTTNSFLVESTTPFPTTNQYINTTVTARTNNYDRDYNYQGTVRYSVEKRDSNSSYWYIAPSGDYTLSNTTSYFYSSDQGYKNISSNLRFYYNGNYRLKAVDDNNSSIVWYKEFTVGWWSASSQNRTVSVDTNITNPTTNQYITTYTTIKDQYWNRDYNYQGTIRYAVDRRENSYWSRYTASSNDYTLSNTTSYFYTSDQWYKTITSHVKFNNSGYYRIRAYDDSNSSMIWYSSMMTVGGSSSTSTSNGFELSTNTTTPWENNFVNLTITAKNSNGYTNTTYSNLVRFKVYRRISSSYDWNEITTSSLDNSAYRIFNSTYNFSSSYNNGSVSISNFIKFYSDDYDYKVRVVDDTNSSIYGEIIYYLKNTQDWNNSNSTINAYRFVATLSPTIPTLNSRFDINLVAKNSYNNTLSNYQRKVNITVERKLTASSKIWNTASSTYCQLNQNSYTFSSSDNGQKYLSDLVKCSKTWFYRVKITDSSNTSVVGYTYFTIPSNTMSSTIPGFSTSQRDEIRNVYKNFMYELNTRQNDSTRLAYNTSWNTRWSDYYSQLYATVYNRTGKFTSYNSYRNEAADFASDLNGMR